MTEMITNFTTWLKPNWMLLLIIAGIAGAFIFLRTKASNIDEAGELSAILHDGRPTIIEFYSNF